HTRFSRDWSSDVCSSDLNASSKILILKSGSIMRLTFQSSIFIALRRNFLTLGCIMGLSACTTAGEGAKTSLLSSSATSSNSERNSDKSVSPDSVSENGERLGEDKNLAALDTPALPQNGPVPGTRSEPQAMQALPDAQAAA